MGPHSTEVPGHEHPVVTSGTYGLLIERSTNGTIEVGALGERSFPSGTYVYVGSAFGPGGFARIERHREVAAGDRATRHWHIDYLLGDPDSMLSAVGKTPGEDRECAIAQSLPGTPIDSFGASDCDCGSHLSQLPSGASPGSVLSEQYERIEELTDY